MVQQASAQPTSGRSASPLCCPRLCCGSNGSDLRARWSHCATSLTTEDKISSCDPMGLNAGRYRRMKSSALPRFASSRWPVSKNKTKKRDKKTGANTNPRRRLGGSGFCPPPSVIPIQPNTIPFPVPSLFESASQYNPVQFSPFHGTPRYVLRTYPGGASMMALRYDSVDTPPNAPVETDRH